MKGLLRLCFAGFCAGLSGGCLDSTVTLSLNRDGSGSVTLEECYSPRLTIALGGNDRSGATNTLPGGVFTQTVAFVTGVAEDRAKEFGGGVQLVSLRRKIGPNKGAGFSAVYAFDDVNRLRIGLNAGGCRRGDDDWEGARFRNDLTSYSFDYAAGDVSALVIKPALALPKTAMTNDVEALPEAKERMARRMLKGFRTRFVVQLNGIMAETDGKGGARDGMNSLTVVDFSMDRLLSSSNGMKLAFSPDPKDQAALSATNIPGVFVSDPSKPITVRFDTVGPIPEGPR